VTQEAVRSRWDQIRARCNDFAREHPQVWPKFVEIALELIRQGQKQYGAQTIFAIIRYQTGLGSDGVNAFKINNDYSPFFARRFQREYPEHANFFRVRHQKSRDANATGLPELAPEDFN
jgi:hypothetical protein